MWQSEWQKARVSFCYWLIFLKCYIIGIKSLNTAINILATPEKARNCLLFCTYLYFVPRLKNQFLKMRGYLHPCICLLIYILLLHRIAFHVGNIEHITSLYEKRTSAGYLCKFEFLYTNGCNLDKIKLVLVTTLLNKAPNINEINYFYMYFHYQHSLLELGVVFF